MLSEQRLPWKPECPLEDGLAISRRRILTRRRIAKLSGLLLSTADATAMAKSAEVDMASDIPRCAEHRLTPHAAFRKIARQGVIANLELAGSASLSEACVGGCSPSASTIAARRKLRPAGGRQEREHSQRRLIERPLAAKPGVGCMRVERPHSVLNCLRGDEHVLPLGSAKVVIKFDDRVCPRCQGRRRLGQILWSEVDFAADAALYFAELDACKRSFNVRVGGRRSLTLHSGTEAARAP